MKNSAFKKDTNQLSPFTSSQLVVSAFPLPGNQYGCHAVVCLCLVQLTDIHTAYQLNVFSSDSESAV